MTWRERRVKHEKQLEWWCFSNIVSTYLPQTNTSAPNYDKLMIESYIDSKIPDEVNFDIPPISYDFVLEELFSPDSKKIYWS